MRNMITDLNKVRKSGVDDLSRHLQLDESADRIVALSIYEELQERISDLAEPFLTAELKEELNVSEFLLKRPDPDDVDCTYCTRDHG